MYPDLARRVQERSGATHSDADSEEQVSFTSFLVVFWSLFGPQPMHRHTCTGGGVRILLHDERGGPPSFIIWTCVWVCVYVCMCLCVSCTHTHVRVHVCVYVCVQEEEYALDDMIEDVEMTRHPFSKSAFSLYKFFLSHKNHFFSNGLHSFTGAESSSLNHTQPYLNPT